MGSRIDPHPARPLFSRVCTRGGALAALVCAAWSACAGSPPSDATAGTAGAAAADAKTAGLDASAEIVVDAQAAPAADATGAQPDLAAVWRPGTCGAIADCTGSVPPCHQWACSANKCQVIAAPVGTACDDGFFCTLSDACTPTAGCKGTAKVCDDGNPCTKDSCAGKDGSCYAVLDYGACDDGDACTVKTSCNNGKCGEGATADCNDANPCTADSCAPATGCAHTPVAALCSDVCHPNAVCQVGVCVLGGALDCDDANSCTADSCTSASGCIHSDSPLPCNVGPCTTGVCNSGVCTKGPALWAVDLPSVKFGSEASGMHVDELGRTMAWSPGAWEGVTTFAVDRLGQLVGKWPAHCVEVLDMPSGSPMCVNAFSGEAKLNGGSAVVQWAPVDAAVFAPPVKKWPLFAQNNAAFMAVYSAGAAQTAPGVWLMGWVATDAPSIEEGYCPWSDNYCGKWNALWVVGSDGAVYQTVTLPPGQNSTHSIGGGATADKGLTLGAFQVQQTHVAHLDSAGKVQWLTKFASIDYNERLILLASGTVGVIGGSGKSQWLLPSGAVFASTKLFDAYPNQDNGSQIALASTGDAGFVVVRRTAFDTTELRRYDANRDLLWQRKLNAQDLGFSGTLMASAIAAGNADSLVVLGGRWDPKGYSGPWMGRLDAFGHISCAQAGLCADKKAADCKDGKACTLDACEPPAGCTSTVHESSCSSGQPCTANELCANGKCGGGVALDCNDNDPCTADSCAAATGCSNVALPMMAPCLGWGVCKWGVCSKP